MTLFFFPVEVLNDVFPVMGYSIFYPHIQGYERPNFEKPTCPGKNDCWLISPLQYNLNWIPQKKMIPEKFFESATPKKVNTANLPTRKIYIEIGTPGKITIQWPPGFLHPYACTDKKWNSPILCHCRTLVNCWGKISKDAKIKKNALLWHIANVTNHYAWIKKCF